MEKIQCARRARRNAILRNIKTHLKNVKNLKSVTTKDQRIAHASWLPSLQLLFSCGWLKLNANSARASRATCSYKIGENSAGLKMRGNNRCSETE